MEAHGTTDRQRTMRTLLDWSYLVLDGDEQAALRRLSVFPAGFTLAAAAAAITSGPLSSPEADAPGLVWALVEKSLLTADRSANDTRYRFLESVRAFAHERLVDEDEAAQAAHSSATWMLERIGPWNRLDRGWVGVAATELDNLRALASATAVTSVEQAQQLGCTIGRFHDSAGSFREGIDEVGRYVRELGASSVSRLALLTTLADLQLRIGDLDGVAEVLAVADSLRDELDGAVPHWDDAGLDRAHGDLLLRQGDAPAAATAARHALSGTQSSRGRSRLWNLLGMAAISQGDLAEAYGAFTEELSLSQELGHEPYIASAYGNLAEVALRRGDESAAARHQAAALELAVQLGVVVTVAYSLIVAARIEASHDHWESAVTLHAAADRLLDETGAALYDDDRRLSDAMLAGALAALGNSEFDRHHVDGRALGVEVAADRAAQVFRMWAGADDLRSA
jgi:tetratricopeptide (TPR) repeat protein